MKDIIFPDAQWSYIDEGHFKKNLRTVLRANKLYRDDAAVLQEHLREAYSIENINSQIMSVISEASGTKEQTADMEPSVFMA